jgi:putative intracellular protease/amidase
MKPRFASLVLLCIAATFHCGKNLRIGEPRVPASAALKHAGNKRILIVVSAHADMGTSGKKTGYWLSEVTHFYHALAREGFEIDFTSPGGAPSVMDPDSFDLGDSLNRTFWENENLRKKIEKPLAPEKIKAGDYAVIFYAGGHGTMWDFPDNPALASLAAKIYESGGVVSAVCHGPSGLVNIKLKDGTKLIANKKLTGFSNGEEKIVGKTSIVPFLLQDRLASEGGIYSSAFLPFSSHVVSDGRLITGQNPGSAGGTGEAVVAFLEKNPLP